MKAKYIFYWATTSLIALETFAGGIMDLTNGRTNIFSGPTVVDVVTSLGYPVYVLVILGIWKIPGAITLVVPGFLRLKEWAYAGIVFELSGAAASQAVRGQPNSLSRFLLGHFVRQTAFLGAREIRSERRRPLMPRSADHESCFARASGSETGFQLVAQAIEPGSKVSDGL